jgi:hypothetical protein
MVQTWWLPGEGRTTGSNPGDDPTAHLRRGPHGDGDEGGATMSVGLGTGDARRRVVRGSMTAPKRSSTCSPTRRLRGARIRRTGGFLRDGCNGSDTEELGSDDDDQWGGEGATVVGTGSMPDQRPVSEKERGCRKGMLAWRLASEVHMGVGSAGSI